MAEDDTETRTHVFKMEIQPLLDAIIEVCNEHKIPFIARFDIPNAYDPDVLLSIQLVKKEWDPPDSMREIGKQWCRETYFGEMLSARYYQ